MCKRKQSKQKRNPSVEHPENEEEGPAKRFCIINQQQQFQLEIPRDMTEYGNSHFNVFFFFFQGKDVKESILTQNHVPFNFPGGKENG